jgi:hypothetical protein
LNRLQNDGHGGAPLLRPERAVMAGLSGDPLQKKTVISCMTDVLRSRQFDIGDLAKERA